MRTLFERAWGALLPTPVETELDDRALDVARRARLLVGILLLCGLNAGVAAAIHLFFANFLFAGWMAALLPIILAFMWAIRVGASVDLVGHATVTGIFAVCVGIAVATGGKVAGGLFFLALVPAAAILVIGRKPGLGWAAATLVSLVGIGAYAKAQGFVPPIEVDVAETSWANLRATGLVLLAITAMAFSFSLVQERARRELERLVSVHQAGERRFRAITERAGDLIAELDPAGRFIFASPGFEEALGWKPEDLIGSVAIDRLHPDDFAVASDAWRVLREKGAVRQEPVRLRHASGQVIWFEISMREYVTASNETRIVSIARDVSERLERESLLRRQDRLAAEGVMAAGAAHQLSNPMGSILAAAQFAKTVQSDPENAELVSKALDSIEEEALRSARIVRSMLAFARNEVADRWVEDLKFVLENAVRSLEGEARSAGVEIVKSLTRAEVRAYVSPIEIEQVVINLVRNAIQAGAKVIVLGLDIEQDSIARITVSDDGPGLGPISPTDAFRAFFTGRTGEGAGLGLTVAREIVLAHEGQIHVARSNADGAVFRVDLPLHRVEH